MNPNGTAMMPRDADGDKDEQSNWDGNLGNSGVEMYMDRAQLAKQLRCNMAIGSLPYFLSIATSGSIFARARA
jgi:hypothetical protein